MSARDILDISWKIAIGVPLVAVLFWLLFLTGVPGIALFAVTAVITALIGNDARS